VLFIIGGIIMLAVNYSTIRNKLKDYCDRVTDDGETVIVTRKDEKNVVIISLDDYNLMMKTVRKKEYMDEIYRRMEMAKQGYVTVLDHLLEDDDANELE
jgi:antitoxin YefM